MTITASRTRLALAALAAALALALVGGTAAQAKPVKVTGSTTVTPSDQLKQFPANNGVSVATTGPATSADGKYTFPIVAGFGDTQTFNGVLVHSGGLRFTKGDRSVVVRRFVAVRAADKALVLAQLPGKRGNCGQVKRALRRFAVNNPRVAKGVRRLAKRYPKAARKAVRALRNYCSDGRVIVLAKLTNLGKSVQGGTATLTADLELSRQAARLVNRLLGKKAVSAGAPLGSAVSTVTPAP